MSDKKNYYYNRELSWMDFNARVLEEAQKKDNPLMERLRFLAITGSNLDEFFMVRVAGVKSQIASNYTKPDDSGMTPKELLSALDKKRTPLWKSSIPAYTALFCRSSKAGGNRVPHAGKAHARAKSLYGRVFSSRAIPRADAARRRQQPPVPDARK